MAEEDDIEKSSEQSGPFGLLSKGFGIIVGNILGAGLPSIFVVIFAILKFVFQFIYFILVKVVPFLVKYVGIPLFILGAIMALLFFGGHIFFTVSFVVGVFLYIKGLYTLSFNLPKQAEHMKNNNTTPSTYKIKDQFT